MSAATQLPVKLAAEGEKVMLSHIFVATQLYVPFAIVALPKSGVPAKSILLVSPGDATESPKTVIVCFPVVQRPCRDIPY